VGGGACGQRACQKKNKSHTLTKREVGFCKASVLKSKGKIVRKKNFSRWWRLNSLTGKGGRRKGNKPRNEGLRGEKRGLRERFEGNNVIRIRDHHKQKPRGQPMTKRRGSRDSKTRAVPFMPNRHKELKPKKGQGGKKKEAKQPPLRRGGKMRGEGKASGGCPIKRNWTVWCSNCFFSAGKSQQASSG